MGDFDQPIERQAQRDQGSTRQRTPGGIRTEKVLTTRDMTPLDMRTDNFTGDPVIRENYLRDFGQCFESGTRYVLEGFRRG